MLSSLGKSLTNLYNTTTTSITNNLSPQSILASYLSKSLAEFFDNVDPNQVETSLTTSTSSDSDTNVAPHVSLKNVNFKPRFVDVDGNRQGPDGLLLLTGGVESIEFSWRWGAGGKSDVTGVNAYITDVQLKVSGVRVILSQPKSNSVDNDDDRRIPQLLSQVKIVKDDEETSTSSKKVSTPATSSTSPPEGQQMAGSDAAAAGSADWKARYMQQILDHLTLTMSDIEIRVDLPLSTEKDDKNSPTTLSSIIVEGSEIELVSLLQSVSLNDDVTQDDDKLPQLRQRIRVGSISSHILVNSSQPTSEASDGGGGGECQNNKTNKIPLLDEFGYRAIVTRISGRRFLDGIMNGLVVTGETILDSLSSSTSQHHQATNMIRLHVGTTQMNALLKLQDLLGIIDTTTTTNDDDTNIASVLPSKNEDEGISNTTQSATSNSSFFNLPIQYIAIVLEEEENDSTTEIKLDGCSMYYRTDGSEFIVDCGSGGILIDDEYITTKGLGHVTIDLVKSCIVVDPHNNSIVGENDDGQNNSLSKTTRVSTPDDPYQTETFYDTLPDNSTGSKANEGETVFCDTVIQMSLGVTLLERIWHGIQPIMGLMEASVLETDRSSTMTTSDGGGSRWTLSINGTVSCRFITTDNSWLMANINSMVVTTGSRELDVTGTAQASTKLNVDGLPFDIEWDAIEVKCSSSTDATIVIAPAKTNLGGEALVVNGAVKATSDSFETLTDIQSIVETFIAVFEYGGVGEEINKDPIQKTTRSNASLLPVRLVLPQVRLALTEGPYAGEVNAFDIVAGKCVANGVEGHLVDWKCSRLHARGFFDNESFFAATNIEGSIENNRSKAACSLSQLCLPTIGRLTQTVDSVELVLEREICTINLGNVIASIKEDTASETANADPAQHVLDLPFDIKVTASLLRLNQATKLDTSSIQAEDLNVIALRNTVSWQPGRACQGMSVKVAAQCKQLDVELVDVMRGSFSQISASLLFGEQKSNEVTRMDLVLPVLGNVPSASVDIGSVSNLDIYGMASLTQPLSSASAVLEKGVVSVELAAINVAIFDDSQNQSGSSTIIDIPFDFKVSTPSLALDLSAISDAKSYFRCSDLELFVARSVDPLSPALSAGAECKYLDIMLDGVVNCCLQGLTGSMVGREQYGDRFSNCVSLSGLGDVSQASMLIESVTKLSVPEAGHLTRPLSSISVIMENGAAKIILDEIAWKHVESRSSKESQDSGMGYALPCPFTVQFQRLDVTQESTSNLTSSYLTCGSTDVQLCPGSEGAWQVNIPRCTEVLYMGMVKVPTVSMTACVHPSHLYTINDLAVLARKVELRADFRSDHWSDSLEDTIIYSLPNVHIHEMDLVLNFQGGQLISVDDAVLRLAAFKGGTNSNSISLTNHYVDKVKSRIPFLLTKANICGTNVGDSVGQTVAAVAMNSTVVGSIVGVVGRDAVGAAITKGKSTRGAGEAEGYQFGDLSRGIAGSARGVARNPSAAASSAAEYTSENRVKLSGAGGAGLGMVAGMALAGPIGLVAGSIIGSKAARSAVAGAFGDPKQKQKGTEESKAPPPSGGQTGHSMAFSQSRQAVPPQDAFRSFHTTTTSNAEMSSAHMAAGVRPPNTNSHQNMGHQCWQQHQAASSTNVHQGAIGASSQVYRDSGCMNTQLSGQQQQQQHAQPVYGHPISTSVPGGPPVHYQTYSPPYGNTRGSSNQFLVQQEQYARQTPTQPASAASQAQYSYQAATAQQSDNFGNHQTTPAVVSYAQQQQRQQQPQQPQQQQQAGGYQFGSITKGIIARGKQRRGQDANSGYKFGDFSRGLFG